jgi:hypothetical protein
LAGSSKNYLKIIKKMDSSKQPQPATGGDTVGATVLVATKAKAPSQAEYEATSEFQKFREDKLREAQAYLKDAWGLIVETDKLVLWRDDAGFPDSVGRSTSHKQIVANQKFRSADGSTLGNYNIWRSLA